MLITRLKRKTAEYLDSSAMHNRPIFMIFKIDHDRSGSHPESGIGEDNLAAECSEVLRNRRLSLEAQERMRVPVETSPAAIVTIDERSFIESGQPRCAKGRSWSQAAFANYAGSHHHLRDARQHPRLLADSTSQEVRLMRTSTGAAPEARAAYGFPLADTLRRP